MKYFCQGSHGRFREHPDRFTDACSLAQRLFKPLGGGTPCEEVSEWWKNVPENLNETGLSLRGTLLQSSYAPVSVSAGDRDSWAAIQWPLGFSRRHCQVFVPDMLHCPRAGDSQRFHWSRLPFFALILATQTSRHDYPKLH